MKIKTKEMEKKRDFGGLMVLLIVFGGISLAVYVTERDKAFRPVHMKLERQVVRLEMSGRSTLDFFYYEAYSDTVPGKFLLSAREVPAQV